MITAEQFKAATGHDPIDDDLERSNCPNAGEIGHHSCGWNKKANMPNFMSYRIGLYDSIYNEVVAYLPHDKADFLAREMSRLGPVKARRLLEAAADYTGSLS